MRSELPYQLLADVVLILHFSIVAFVVGGLVLTIVGNLSAWRWVNALWFRLAHLAAIGVVVTQAWFGATCPLTSLEMWLRANARATTYSGSFIEHWLQRLLYYEAPSWLFTLVYSLFGLLVAATWWRFPPTPKHGANEYVPDLSGMHYAKPTTMSQRSTFSQTVGLVAWLGIVFVAAAIGAAASVEASTFYSQLVRPAWAPPASAFGPVWSVLYLLMGIAVWLVWRERNASHLRTALALFIAQLCANSLWSWLFFAWRNGAVAFAEVLILLALIAATVTAFWRISRPAGALMLPYLAWVCLASALTWSVWQSNPNAL